MKKHLNYLKLNHLPHLNFLMQLHIEFLKMFNAIIAIISVKIEYFKK